MKSKRSKACDIPLRVKKKVWGRDEEKCVVCGRHNAMPNAHYISRAQGGLGIEQNVVTLCLDCHNKYDNTIFRKDLKEYLKRYLQSKYPNWNEKDLVYKKGEVWTTKKN